MKERSPPCPLILHRIKVYKSDIIKSQKLVVTGMDGVRGLVRSGV